MILPKAQVHVPEQDAREEQHDGTNAVAPKGVAADVAGRFGRSVGRSGTGARSLAGPEPGGHAGSGSDQFSLQSALLSQCCLAGAASGGNHRAWPGDRRSASSSCGIAPGIGSCIDELLADVRSGHNITKTVFIECGSMYRADGPAELKPVGETEFVNGTAAMSASGQYGPARLCSGIVGHADLRLGDRVARCAGGADHRRRRPLSRDPSFGHLGCKQCAGEGAHRSAKRTDARSDLAGWICPPGAAQSDVRGLALPSSTARTCRSRPRLSADDDYPQPCGRSGRHRTLQGQGSRNLRAMEGRHRRTSHRRRTWSSNSADLAC